MLSMIWRQNSRTPHLAEVPSFTDAWGTIDNDPCGKGFRPQHMLFGAAAAAVPSLERKQS
jgi:hypothetical protein